ncbi:methyltransferase, putative [hydrothermal vent metagenome]|uniref:Methyltransferase, putative n=1 Tax=hydrothermal vent metagenome TaxID=652676 RepID=A0A1W1CNE0_9ZZZZ
MAIDHFANKSKSWDMNSKRVQNAKSIAQLIIDNVKLDSTMKVMDFGAGTGLLSYFVAPYVDTIVAVDNSPSMLEKFKEKSLDFSCKTEVLELDLSKENIEQKFDGIISSMTIHHIKDTKVLFEKFYKMLNDDGFIAIADLDSEDGTFHSDNRGVFHFGFEQKELEKIAKEIGFKEIRFELANTIKKPHQEFTVFLMLAIR